MFHSAGQHSLSGRPRLYIQAPVPRVPSKFRTTIKTIASPSEGCIEISTRLLEEDPEQPCNFYQSAIAVGEPLRCHQREKTFSLKTQRSSELHQDLRAAIVDPRYPENKPLRMRLHSWLFRTAEASLIKREAPNFSIANAIKSHARL